MIITEVEVLLHYIGTASPGNSSLDSPFGFPSSTKQLVGLLVNKRVSTLLCSPELLRRKVLWKDFLSCIDLALMLPLRESQYSSPSNKGYAAVIIQQWARLLCLTKGKWKERSGLAKNMKVQYSCLRSNSEQGECETCLDTPLKDFQAQLVLLSL